MRGKFIRRGALIVIGLFLLAMDVRAAGDVRCELLTIAASKSKKGVDTQLKSFSAVFKQPPFVEFNTFKLVKRKIYPMELNKPVSLEMPPSIKGNLRLRGVAQGQFKLTLELSRMGKEPVEIEGRASPKTPFFAAGFANPAGGVWVFGILCNHADIVAH